MVLRKGIVETVPQTDRVSREWRTLNSAMSRAVTKLP
jgi:hypothetical protein